MRISSRLLIGRSTLMLAGLVASGLTAHAQVTVYTNDGSTTSGFTSPNLNIATRTSGTPAQTYLADPTTTFGFGNGTATLTLNNAALVGTVTASFDLYIIGSMDGNGPNGGGPDPWMFAENGSTIFNTTFANYTGGNTQSFVSLTNFTGNMVAPRTGSDAALAGQLGFGTGDFGDSTYHLSFTFANATPTLALNFISGLNEGPGNEGWGLDNISVTSVPTPAVTPEPGSVALLVGMGLSGAGFLARRRKQAHRGA